MSALPITLPEADDIAASGLRKPASGLESGEHDEGLESELPVPEGELLGGRYIVERIFAEGGMGIVCYGRHAQLEQPVAIKFLRRALAGKPQVVERFLNEGRALAALRSEHVVRVIDVGQLESGRPYLVMEHLEGIDLDALVDRDGPLSVETAVGYALQICEPLGEAHALGIVHRDIKPENLFLWSGGPGRDVVKVLDFGLAKQFGSSRAIAVTGPQDSMGSPCYMSPEQITTPQNIDTRTDIWSLGVVLHRLLTDTLPFDGNSIIEVLSHVLSAAPKPLSAARPELSFDPVLEGIVRRCLEKSPAERYATMAELAEALSTYLAQRSAQLAHAEQGALALAPLPPAVLPERPAEPARRVFDGDEEKIRIPGVHARWPAVLLVAAALGAAGLYQAHRIGLLPERAWAARLKPPRLAADPPAAPLIGDDSVSSLGLVRGVFAETPTRDAQGALALRAEPERDTSGPSIAPREEPLSVEDAARKEAAYRAYLEGQGVTPRTEVPAVGEVPPAPEEAPAPDVAPAATALTTPAAPVLAPVPPAVPVPVPGEAPATSE